MRRARLYPILAREVGYPRDVPTSPPIDEADRDLLAAVHRSLSQAEAACADRLDYGRGCPRCCYGPFAINALDAHRLRRGLAELHARDSERARAIVRRARRSAALFAEAFPGVAGRLDEDDGAVEAFCARFAAEPCPALDTTLRPLRPLRVAAAALPDVRAAGAHRGRRAGALRVVLQRLDERGRAWRRPWSIPNDAKTRSWIAWKRTAPWGETVIAFALADGPVSSDAER